MRKDIIIIGAGGLGREILWLLEEQNNKELVWNIIGFVDDNDTLKNKNIKGYPVLGTVEWLSNYSNYVSVVCAIANPFVRANIINNIKYNEYIQYPNIIAEGVKISDSVNMGIGNIICTSSILTTDINIGNFTIIDINSTIGHDAVIGDYVMIYPSVNISGFVNIGKYTEIGTGTQVIQGLSICDETIIGAGAVVVKNVAIKGTYVGVPVRRIY